MLKPKLLLGIKSNFTGSSKHFLFIDTNKRLSKPEICLIKRKLIKKGYSRLLIFDSGKSSWILSFIPKTFNETKKTYKTIQFKDNAHYQIGLKDRYWVIRITPKNEKQIRLKYIIQVGLCSRYDHKAEAVFLDTIHKFRKWR